MPPTIRCKLGSVVERVTIGDCRSVNESLIYKRKHEAILTAAATRCANKVQVHMAPRTRVAPEFMTKN